MSKLERDRFFESIDSVLDEHKSLVGSLPMDVQNQVKENFEAWQAVRAGKISQLVMQMGTQIEPVAAGLPAEELVAADAQAAAYRAA